MMGDNDNDDAGSLGTITICAGPPRCDLQGDEAVGSQRAGCLWCMRIIMHADGTETTLGPAIA